MCLAHENDKRPQAKIKIQPNKENFSHANLFNAPNTYVNN